MLITNSDLKKALQQQEKNIILEIDKFLEEHVIKPIFDLRKDVKEVKHDIEQMDRKLEKSIEWVDRHRKKIEDHEKRITSLETFVPQI